MSETSNIELLGSYPDVLEPCHIREILGSGRAQVYTLMRSGQFHVVRVGRDYKVSKVAFLKWLNGM